MPARYWIALEDVRPPVRGEHLHAAISRWFDESQADDLDAHHAVVKPYTISPVASVSGQYGVEVSVLSDVATERLLARTSHGCRIRLGGQLVRCSSPRLISHVTWPGLLEGPTRQRWELTFVTPTAFRTGSRSSPLPTPSVVLRAPTEAWSRFSGLDPLALAAQDASHVWVSTFSMSCDEYEVSGRRVTGVLGSVTYQCSERRVAEAVGPLFRLAPYCGVGSFRGKGFGIVELVAA